MDLIVHNKPVVNISVDKVSNDVLIQRKEPISIDVKKSKLQMNIGKSPNLSFEFIKNIVGTAGIYRLTTTEFEALATIKENAWYFVTDYRGQLKFIYAGSTLFAKADIQGDMGFPYTFPITF